MKAVSLSSRQRGLIPRRKVRLLYRPPNRMFHGERVDSKSTNLGSIPRRPAKYNTTQWSYFFIHRSPPQAGKYPVLSSSSCPTNPPASSGRSFNTIDISALITWLLRVIWCKHVRNIRIEARSPQQSPWRFQNGHDAMV